MGRSGDPFMGRRGHPFMGHFTALFPPKKIHSGKSNGQKVHPMNAYADYASKAEAKADSCPSSN